MINKVKQTPVAKKATSSEIRKQFSVSDSYDELCDDRCNVTLRKGNSSFGFSVDVRQDEFCCGMFTLGGFNINQSTAGIPETNKVEAVKELFGKMVEAVKIDNQEITLILTLIDNAPCNLIKKAFADGRMFTKVKTFKNINSSKFNDLYVSN